MCPELPTDVTVNQLKRRAKTILSSHKAGDSSCCELLRMHPRLKNMTDEEILKETIVLREVQHALAVEYGFRSWTKLRDEYSYSRTAGETQSRAIDVSEQQKVEYKTRMAQLLAFSIVLLLLGAALLMHYFNNEQMIEKRVYDFKEGTFCNLKIGDHIDKAAKLYGPAGYDGQPISYHGRYDKRYTFDDIELHTKDSRILNIITCSRKIETDAGLRMGNPVSDIVKKYGEPFFISKDNGSYFYRMDELMFVIFVEGEKVHHYEILLDDTVNSSEMVDAENAAL